MNNEFSPSVNLVRDKGKRCEYIPTANAERVIQNLNENVARGIRSFYLVGSIGTGKSSFLLALKNQLDGKVKLFKTPISFNRHIKYEFKILVGDYCSFELKLREKFNISRSKDIIDELDNYYQRLSSTKRGLFIIVDELGKFLEYASINRPEKELYLIQRLAEFVNDPTKNIIFLTTLHQGFDAYRSRLDEKTRNEWEKVKGRLKEIPFNEPVEQLLHLAAKYLNGEPKNISAKEFNELYQSIINSRVYPLHNSLGEKIAEQLYPLDVLSAGILAKALQRYGQNERSLFTFLKTTDFNKYISKNKKFFNLPDVYDYLINNFYSLLSSKFNPDYLKWTVIRTTLERAEILFENEYLEKEKIIKTIGLLNIFAPAGSKINSEFLRIYGSLSLNVYDVENKIRILEKNKLIRFQSYSNSYVLFEGTDVDIDLALSEAENYVNKNFDLVSKLKEYFYFPFLSAKASYIRKGTPRFFEFILSEEPIQKKPIGEVDGIINLIFDNKVEIARIILESKNYKEAILYAIYENSELIRTNILEIEKANYVLEKYNDDRIVKREIKSLIEKLIADLNELVIDSLFYKDSKVKWVFDGQLLNIDSRATINKVLSKIVDKVYDKTPILQNELINREKLPGTINLARKELFKKMFESWDKPDLGFDKEKFPPEKTIYLSLLKNTGIHRKENGLFILGKPLAKSFIPLWECCEEFLESAKTSKKCLADLIDILSKKPYKLKSGFVAFWLPIYLFIRRDDYALYDEDVYIPELTDDLIEMILKNPRNYFIKTLDVRGIKLELFNRYRKLINRSSEVKVTSKGFIDTIKPFLIFYRGLPEYTKKTTRLSKEAKFLRDAIAKAKDPEKTFFEDFPNALGFTTSELFNSDKNLKYYVDKLFGAIRELRLCFDELLNRIEKTILQSIGEREVEFPIYKEMIVNRYSNIKTFLFLPHQRTIYQRINSGLNERKTWISSFIQSIIGKSLETISDNDEEIIHEKIKNIFQEFDSLIEITNLEIDIKKETAYKVEITSINDDTKRAIIRLNKEQEKLAKEIENNIRKNLSEDKSLNRIALLNLLKEEINNNSSK